MRGSGVAHYHLQIVLVHPGHRVWCGCRGTGGSIPLGNVGQCEAHIDVARAKAGQVFDAALGGEHIDGDARIAGVDPFRENLRERQIQPARIARGQARASAGFAADAAGGEHRRREDECATTQLGRSVGHHVDEPAAGSR